MALLSPIDEPSEPVFAYFAHHDAEVDAAAVKRVVRSYVGEQLRLGTMPRIYRTALRSSLAELFAERPRGAALAELIYEARVTHGYKLIEIARHLRMHRDTAGLLFRSARRARGG